MSQTWLASFENMPPFYQTLKLSMILYDEVNRETNDQTGPQI
jgi:hypothetical protein